MKNILNRILILSFIAILTFSSFVNVQSLETLKDNKLLKIYDVKEKEEVLVENNKIIDFYEDTHEEVQVLIEEKKEQERIAEQKRLEEQRRLEEERRLAEQRRLEEERRRQQQYTYNQANVTGSNSEIVNFALQFVGNPYVYGGTSLTNGTDCSGFVMSVYANFGVSLPRTAPAQSRVGVPVSIENIQPGDIVSYTFDGVNPGHSALYIGNGQIIHAATPQLGIRIDGLTSMPIYGIRRVI